MSTRPSFKKKNLFIALIMVVVILVIIVTIFLLRSPEEKKSDYHRISSESYDAVFLSMYPIDHFYEEDYAHWRGMDLVKTTYEIPNFSTLKNYMKKIEKSGNPVDTIYLGVHPEKLNANKLTELLLSYPTIRFEIILPNPSLDYWLSLSEEECSNMLDAYYDFTLSLLNHENISLYYFGASEWLIANPANYSGDFVTMDKASVTIMLHSDQNHSYIITEEKITEQLAKLSDLIASNRSAPVSYPDLSDYSIIFLGDSVIANYNDSLSIPGVVNGLTNAQVFNLGLGGGSAAQFPEANCTLATIVPAVLQKDATLLNANPEAGTEADLLDRFSIYQNAESSENLCFVINYGLNDYFLGLPIASDDPYDSATYTGAIRSAVRTIRETYPEAPILLITPNFTVQFTNGTEKRAYYESSEGHVLSEYADSLIALSEELDVKLLDNHNELDITAKNWSNYLSDGCHPNESGRFLIGQRIALKLAE